MHGIGGPYPDSTSRGVPSEDRRFFTVRATGASMSPFIVDRDIIHVQELEASEIKTGMVAVYRNESGGMVAHRFFGFVRKRGATVLKVRGDGSPGSFAHVQPEQVVGQVVAVQRGSAVRRIDTWYWRRLGWAWGNIHPIGTWLLGPGDWLYKLGEGAMAVVQLSRWYRRTARRRLGRRAIYRVAERDDLLHLSREKSYGHHRAPVGSEVHPMEEDHRVVHDANTFVACLGTKVVGSVGVIPAPDRLGIESNWMITGLWVHWRYRGAGIGRGLLIMAGTTLLGRGVPRMVASVWDCNTGALALADNVGANRPSWSQFRDQMSASPLVLDSVLLSKDLREGLGALHERGILEEYRHTGCCDAYLNARSSGSSGEG
jgi:hypothetical protein